MNLRARNYFPDLAQSHPHLAERLIWWIVQTPHWTSEAFSSRDAAEWLAERVEGARLRGYVIDGDGARVYLDSLATENLEVVVEAGKVRITNG